MSDDIPIRDANDAIVPVATDEVGGRRMQIVKLDVGGDGASLPLVSRGTIPRDDDAGVPVRPVPVDFWRCGFAGVGAGLVTADLQLEQVGAGMGVSQSAGNLVISTGTTPNSETVIRSTRTFRGGLVMRHKTILSQRIVNQAFRVELADLIGNGLAYTINSATSVTVTWPTGQCPFTAANVGQSMRLSEITDAGAVPGRYAIASVSGDDVTVTVAGWPASGTGTLTLYGRNYLMTEYSGTTSTTASVDAQRDGWNSGNSNVTINTSGSPGHVMQLSTDVMSASWSDGTVSSSSSVRWTERADRIENIPDDDVDLYLFLVAQNGSTAPASNTLWTIGYVQVEVQGRQKVRIASSDPVGAQQAQPVAIRQSVTITTNPTPSSTLGTGTAYLRLTSADTNAVNVRNAATTIGFLHVFNDSATKFYLKLYNKTTAPVLASDTPEMVIPVPPGTAVSVNCGPFGLRFATGVSIAVVRGIAHTDTTPVALNDGVIMARYT
jgi:hypothetical protein